ncbi:MAG: YggS family pyridoxal phosphate-dependent enzyme [Acidobacteria bacterium]|nr:YggS family pyridoxal phosphate-dependent enzyme [Acidobacteriota bacterium]MBW4045784.1 YggS family pyridoxal phosphate-dependent enzyme [Acidobacteriota bacterium]
MSSDIYVGVTRTLESITIACRRAGRNSSDIRLMAVSKTHPAEAMVEALRAGLTLFGENRVQEYERKSRELDGVELPGAPEVHLIGHLQSNKAARAVQFFQSIDTLDSLRLAERINEAAAKAGRVMPVLLEVKLSSEESKSGLSPEGEETERLLEALPGLANLKVNGLMTVAPLDDDPEVARACFRRLRQHRDAWAAKHQRLDLHELSMGMSGDYEIAIEEGSTMIRLGTAIFGARETPV